MSIEKAVKLNNGHVIEKAPNGQDSILFKSLLVLNKNNHAAAVNDKLKVYSDQFIEWFGDWINGTDCSRVVDVNGEPLIVYHNSKQQFTEFSKEKSNWFFFSDSVQYVSERFEGECLYPVYLNIKNPIEGYIKPFMNAFERGSMYEQYIEHYNDVSYTNPTQQNYVNLSDWLTFDMYNEYKQIQELQDIGIRGKDFNNHSDSFEYGVYQPNQIKSFKNVGTFSKNSNNILR